MTNLKYRRGATCCCLTPLLAPPVPFNIASRKELWSHYGEVALAARLAHVCSTERAGLQGQNETSLLALCVIAWCQCVLGVLFLFPPSHDLPSPTGKRVWVGKEEGGGRRGGVSGNGGGVGARPFPSFPNPGNRLLASVSEIFLHHVTGFSNL